MEPVDFEIVKKLTADSFLLKIAEKVYSGRRITDEEGLALFEKAPLPYVMLLASYIKEQKTGKKVFFNKNFHIEPTNICIYKCQFCSYRRDKNDTDAWDYSIEEMLNIVRQFQNKDVTEVHIVGGVHPEHDVHFYGKLIREIKKILPGIHVKAFTAIELYFMIKKAKMDMEEGLRTLKAYGLDSIPGGGAEIFDKTIRRQICADKGGADLWLKVHQLAHQNGIPSNATILYGHVEAYKHRIDHMSRLRELQDQTGGFNAFIPLKYKKANNKLSHVGEVPITEDMRNFAVSRIYLDNFAHIKAYWPMLGKEETMLALHAGADDIDGTIEDTTKIYSMAGAEEKNPVMTVSEMVHLVKKAGYIPVERDSVYHELKKY